MFYIAQAIGIIALIIAILSFQQNTQKRIVTYQMVSSVFFAVHFFLLGAYAGAALNFIGIFRAMLFRQKEKKWASNMVWLWLFSALFILAGVLSWKNIYSLLPILGMLLTTVGFWIENPRYVRIVTAPSSPLWFWYNLVNQSYPGMLTECFVFGSILIAAFRFDIFPAIKKG